MKKRLALFLVIILVFSLGLSSIVHAKDGRTTLEVLYQNIQLIINGKNVSYTEENEPFIHQGRTYVPLRLLASGLGNNVNWDASTSTAVIGGTPGLVNDRQAIREKYNLAEIIDYNAAWENVAVVESNLTDNIRFIEGMSFDRDGQLWFCDILGGKVCKVVDGKIETVIDRDRIPGFLPNGTKFHKDGRLFIVDQQQGILAYDPATGTIETIVAKTDPDPDFAQLNDIAFDKNGGLYITECGSSHALKADGKVWYLAPGESIPSIFAENLAYPNGIAVSACGKRVYIAEFNRNQIISVPAIGSPGFPPEAPFVFCRLEGGIGPDGLAVDGKGNLYAAHLEAGEVAVINSMGILLGTISLPEGNGLIITNLEFHGSYLYATESFRNNIIRRIKVKNTGLEPFGLQ